MSKKICKLKSYIAPSAPARRKPATGNEPYLRPEIGFTPNWYRKNLDIDFGKRWHFDPSYRRDTIIEMKKELRRRFSGTTIGQIDEPDHPLDLLTGTYGGTFVAALYGIPIRYSEDDWPKCEKSYLSDEEIDKIEPIDYDCNPLFQDLLSQIDWIAKHEGNVKGYINWQGVLNNAERLRGEQIFMDLLDNPKRCYRLFECICITMIEGIKRLHKRQKESGIDLRFATVSNCLVNMISPELYREFFLPLDKKIAETFGCIGIHNCAWTADPYLDSYAEISNIGYIDMGVGSDLRRTRKLFPDVRRALMYTPMDLFNKPLSQVRNDLEMIAQDYGPCDVIIADIDVNTPDDKILRIVDFCRELGESK